MHSHDEIMYIAYMRSALKILCAVRSAKVSYTSQLYSIIKMAVLEKNPISRLQELCQQWKFPIPTYREAQGSFQEFGAEVHLVVEGEAVTFQGRGRTKKLAKTRTAEEVLAYIQETKPHLLEPPPQSEVDESAIMEAQGIWKKGTHTNQQRAPALDQRELARETERLDHVYVGLDLGRLIQQTRLKQHMSQKDLAIKINEKVVVIVDYECGRALPNPQVMSKLERALGIHLMGEKTGQVKLRGRGRGGF